MPIKLMLSLPGHEHEPKEIEIEKPSETMRAVVLGMSKEGVTKMAAYLDEAAAKGEPIADDVRELRALMKSVRGV